MAETETRKKIILITGPVAPPYGGVSIHISRLTSLLDQKYHFDFIDESRVIKDQYFNIRKLNIWGYIKKIRKADLLYVNSGKAILRIAHIISARIFSKKTILVVHSFSTNKKRLSLLTQARFYKLANSIMAVNPEIKTKLSLKENCIVKDAFIPPFLDLEPQLPAYINEWLSRNVRNHETIICANASKLNTFQNQDLYGLDLCIEVSRRLMGKGIPFKFIFIVASIDKNEEEFLKNKTLISQFNLDNNFLLTADTLSFVNLMDKSDIILRPTNTDGDSLTIREALFLNKPVLASDIVKRPEGVKLFKNRDIDDLEMKLEEMMQYKSKSVKKANPKNDLDEIESFYYSLIERTLNNVSLN